jgi:ectoine hydroxylase-related dioxygenase (phytanoyl-CoA dioxygenase family)
MQCLLYEDTVFEEALMNPVLLALVTHLCGFRAVLSSMGCFLKGPNKTPFGLHTDIDLPSPLPPYAMVCNATWMLTDMTRENGSTAFVPGSHKWCRRPVGPSAGGHDVLNPTENPQAVPLECDAGSLVVWHGNTWHGAYNRTAPGLRVQVPVYMARHNFRTQENMVERITEEMLDRNDPRFAFLVQQGVTYGYTTHTDGMERAARAFQRTGAYLSSIGGPAFDDSHLAS